MKRLKLAAMGIAVFITIGDQPAHGWADPRAFSTTRGSMSEVYLPAVVTRPEMTVAALAWAYTHDPLSRYHKGVYVTRQNTDALLRRLVNEHGHEAIELIKPRVVLEWHREWTGPDEKKVAMGHSLIGALRTIVGYGATMLQDEACTKLKTTLCGLRFPMCKSRDTIITAEQVIAIRREANRRGLRSIALAQALQFSLIFRQKDIIGQWVPRSEKVNALYMDVDADRKWLSGLHWSEIDDDLILRHTTSKTKEYVEFDLKLAPMAMTELKRLGPFEAQSGPVVISEETGEPYSAVQFRRVWRTIARAAGVPDNVKQMDTRAGGGTESFELGADGSQVKKAMTHKQQSMTDRYNRGRTTGITAVATLRAPKHAELEAEMEAAA